MTTSPRNAREPRLVLRAGSLSALCTILLSQQAEHVYLQPVLSPLFSVSGERVRHAGITVSACLEKRPGFPVVYATFLAGTATWGERHGRLLSPRLDGADPLRHQPVPQAIEQVQEALLVTLEQALHTIPGLVLARDAQWEVPDVWAALSRGVIWQESAWQIVPPLLSSIP